MRVAQESWAVVVPTIRPDQFALFLEGWMPLFAKYDVTLYAVYDLEERPAPLVVDVPLHTFDRRDVRQTADLIPTGSDMIRSFGFYRAWSDRHDFIVSLDDDVLPIFDIFDAYKRGFETPQPISEYFHVGALTETVPLGVSLPMRGFPYAGRDAEVAVQYGGWHGVPDLGAVEQLALGTQFADFSEVVIPVPRGAALTTCAMNFAFRAEHTRHMWQLPLLEGRYNRFGDIWSGLLQKRIFDQLGQVVLINGKASVMHQRASNPFANARREAPGLEINERLWAALDDLYIGNDVYEVFASAFDEVDPAYAKHFMAAREQWNALFS